MSKLFRTLAELQEARSRTSLPVGAERMSPDDLKNRLLFTTASEKHKPTEHVSFTLEEFERLEREFLDLQEKQKAVLLKIKEALTALEKGK